jgi:hypothetical protein
LRDLERVTVRACVEALRGSARAFYANWVDQANERGEIWPGAQTADAAAVLDIQSTTLLVQMVWVMIRSCSGLRPRWRLPG